MRERLTYANVVSTLCLFLLLGGGAYAATRLPKNSVGTKQLKNNAVTGAKIKKGTITGSRIKISSLGTVPTATSATHAGSADTLPPTEAMHVVGTPGEPQFENGSGNVSDPSFPLQPVAFYKDHEGIVHLEGVAQVGKGTTITAASIFTLPPGFRPAAGQLLEFVQNTTESFVIIGGSETPFAGLTINGNVLGKEKTAARLSGITFRAGS